MKYLILVIGFGLLVSCSKRIEITNEYVYNEYWNEYNNAIGIEKMKVIDSTLDIFSEDFQEQSNHWNIVNKLEIDSTFNSYYGGLNIKNPNKPKLNGKVFFDKYNGWNWSLNGEKKKRIGKLENNTWYKFSHLKTTAMYKYVFVDSYGKTYIFTVNLDNF